MLEQNPETANILHPGTSNKSTAQGSNDEGDDEKEDEEIPSDGEDAKNESDNDDEGEEAANGLKLPSKRKHKMVSGFVRVMCMTLSFSMHEARLASKGDVGSCLFTEVKPCWTRWIRGWVTI